MENNKLIIHRFTHNFSEYEELDNVGWRNLCSERKKLPYGFFYPEYQNLESDKKIMIIHIYVSPLSNITNENIMSDFANLFNVKFDIDVE